MWPVFGRLNVRVVFGDEQKLYITWFVTHCDWVGAFYILYNACKKFCCTVQNLCFGRRQKKIFFCSESHPPDKLPIIMLGSVCGGAILTTLWHFLLLAGEVAVAEREGGGAPNSLRCLLSLECPWGAGRWRRRTTVTRRTRARWWRWWRPTKSARRGEERPPSFCVGLVFYLCSFCYCILRINLFTSCPMSSKWSANLQEQNNGRNGFCREAWENCRFTGPLMSELGRN